MLKIVYVIIFIIINRNYQVFFNRIHFLCLINVTVSFVNLKRKKTTKDISPKLRIGSLRTIISICLIKRKAISTTTLRVHHTISSPIYLFFFQSRCEIQAVTQSLKYPQFTKYCFNLKFFSKFDSINSILSKCHSNINHKCDAFEFILIGFGRNTFIDRYK